MPRAKKLRNNEILRRHYEDGETYKSIANDLGISHGRVVDISSEHRQKMRKRFSNGESPTEISVDYSLSPEIVRHLVETAQARYEEQQHRWHEEAYKHNSENTVNMASFSSDIYLWFRKGGTVSEISEEFDISEEAVLRILEQHLASVFGL